MKINMFFIYDMHHIVSDGTSVVILSRNSACFTSRKLAGDDAAVHRLLGLAK
jgi:hypothetical protein